jgi:hypothetical protein
MSYGLPQYESEVRGKCGRLHSGNSSEQIIFKFILSNLILSLILISSVSLFMLQISTNQLQKLIKIPLIAMLCSRSFLIVQAGGFLSFLLRIVKYIVNFRLSLSESLFGDPFFFCSTVLLSIVALHYLLFCQCGLK